MELGCTSEPMWNKWLLLLPPCGINFSFFPYPFGVHCFFYLHHWKDNCSFYLYLSWISSIRWLFLPSLWASCSYLPPFLWGNLLLLPLSLWVSCYFYHLCGKSCSVYPSLWASCFFYLFLWVKLLFLPISLKGQVAPSTSISGGNLPLLPLSLCRKFYNYHWSANCSFYPMG